MILKRKRGKGKEKEEYKGEFPSCPWKIGWKGWRTSLFLQG